MSVVSKTKAWKLPSKFDSSDPNAKILEADLLQKVKKTACVCGRDDRRH